MIFTILLIPLSVPSENTKKGLNLLIFMSLQKVAALATKLNPRHNLALHTENYGCASSH